jgi:hypothetical protein
MNDKENQDEQGNVQANNNSMAVGGNINVENVRDSKVHIGNVINNYAAPEQPELSELNETEWFEPETVYIPEGSFPMGNGTGGTIPNYMPQHDVSLPEYRISKQPVSNTQYEEFMRQTGKSAPIGWLSRRAPEGREDMPVTGVTWFDALEYCKWLSNLTSKKYALPNEAQLARAYMGDDGISDPVDKVYQWTCTLWGDKMDTPDRKYGHPWKDDGRNNLNANRQIRRMVCVYRKNDASTSAHLFKRTGELPGDSGLPGARYGFRVVLSA